MKELKFKTNIKCEGCIATVTPYLEKIDGIKEWTVNTDSPDKILSVSAEENKKKEIIAAIKEAGYEIKPLKKGLFHF